MNMFKDSIVQKLEVLSVAKLIKVSEFGLNAYFRGLTK